MRFSLLVTALLLVGCDAFFDPEDDRDRQGFVERLEGAWTLTTRSERIAYDGTVTPDGQPETRALEVDREVECNRGQRLRAEGETTRAYVTSDPAAPEALRTCGLLTVDRDGERIVFLGLNEDVAGNIVERGGDRQEWHFLTVLTDRTVVRTIWALTR